MHSNINPLPILGKVILDRNAQYEIYLTLGQNKLQKIKNKIIEDGREKINMREQHIDEHLRHIKQLALDRMDLQQMTNFYCENSDDSSELESCDSIKQTSKYFYVEYLEQIREQYRVRKSLDAGISSLKQKGRNEV